MAFYLVQADLKPELREQLVDKLRGDRFLHLQPFGRALTTGLVGARQLPDGRAAWEEEDYCHPPLAQERAAVLDEYFTNLQTEPVSEGEAWRRLAVYPRLFPELNS